ncbi:MAG: helix-turn-helix transcriptional regulator [Leptospira bouyouniensis]|uniref:XRE family transcriptional regulator n=1 Tax=Leptospira bouyouniensis TaxID=2484911 RepID=A0ABY2LDE7_9LEPT|nr:helix-turn-helix transcriptional regulator [Leptospira bouyouniensis]TGK54181.1 XRE family transcriptional regulator [Leptospira bouyouniensis]
MKITRTYSRLAKEAGALLGKEIQLARKEKAWSEQTLAERIGISRTTLQKIESGDMTVAIGLALEAAVILGIPLFATESPSLSQSIQSASDKLTLMPKRIRTKTKKVKDDF